MKTLVCYIWNILLSINFYSRCFCSQEQANCTWEKLMVWLVYQPSASCMGAAHSLFLALLPYNHQVWGSKHFSGIHFHWGLSFPISKMVAAISSCLWRKGCFTCSVTAEGHHQPHWACDWQLLRFLCSSTQGTFVWERGHGLWVFLTDANLECSEVLSLGCTVLGFSCCPPH